jgi:hypothetical protein
MPIGAIAHRPTQCAPSFWKKPAFGSAIVTV